MATSARDEENGKDSAQSILAQIFRCETRNTPREEVDRAVGLLQEFPALAQKTYLTKRHPSARIPLFILAERGATVEQLAILKGYCNNNEMALTLAAQAGLSRMSCKPELSRIMEGGRAGLDVVSWLVQEYPDLLQQKDALGRGPIHKFFQRWTYGFYAGQIAECETLALRMMELCPSCCDLDLFQLSLQAGASDPIVQYLIEKLKGRTLHDFHFQGSFNGTVSIRDAQAIAQVLPQLKDFSFHFIPATPSPEAFSCLMNAIAETNSLQKLSLTLDGGYLKRHGPQAGKALQTALATPRLEEVSLHVTTAERWHDFELSVIVNGLTARATPLHTVKFLLTAVRSMQPLLNVLASPLCPKLVRLQGGCWEHENEPIFVEQGYRDTSLESLLLVGCTMKDEAIQLLMEQVIQTPSVQTFKLLDTANAFSSKVLEQVVEWLQQATTHLKELEVVTNREGIPCATICPLLHPESSLRAVSFSACDEDDCLLDALKQNTAIQSLQCITSSVIRNNDALLKKIGYYVHLNRSGRKRARDLHLSKESLVDLLSNVGEVRETPHHTETHPGAGSILYGLLRENPTLWTASDAEWKRRASQILTAQQQQQEHPQPPTKKARTC